MGKTWDVKKMVFHPVLDDVPANVMIESNDGGELFVHKVVFNGNWCKFFKPIEYNSGIMLLGTAGDYLKLDRKFDELKVLFSFLYSEHSLAPSVGEKLLVI